MKILGFNFTKIGIEKLKEVSSKVKVNTKIDISSINEVKEGILKADFVYEIIYNPEIANIKLEGNLFLLVEDNNLSKEIAENWKNSKDKKINSFKVSIFNLILRKANIKALDLEEQVGLMPHMPLPSFKAKD